ncbi:hypothetical protein D3C78_1439260 [compost metagenome]
MGRQLIGASRQAQRLGQRHASIAHHDRGGQEHFAHHKDLAVIARRHTHDVARPQHHLIQVLTAFNQRGQVHTGAAAIANDIDGAAVGGGQQASRAVDRFKQGHRNVVDRNRARQLDLAFDVDALAAIAEHAYRDLRILDVLAGTIDYEIARLKFRQPRHFQQSRIGKLDVSSG